QSLAAANLIVQIGNPGGPIGGNASITLNGDTVSTDSLTVDISGGSVGAGASIAMNVSDTVTITNDATVSIDVAPSGTNSSASIDLEGGSYEVGGTLLSTINSIDGGITINTAAMHADIIKIGAFGDNGSLTIGGGSISADTLLELYATGSNGVINFVSNSTLNSTNSSVVIAGRTVTINDGVVVTITGNDGINASVFTDVPNYTGSGGNGNTTGTFAGNGAATQPFDQAPPFSPQAGGESPQAAEQTSRTGASDSRQPGAIRDLRRFPVARVSDSDQLLALVNQVTQGNGQSRDENTRSSLARPTNAAGDVTKRPPRFIPELDRASLIPDGRGPAQLP
ncbi:MAG: hypothetical protein M3Q46_11530, partial [Verrucomicrobiota bacterium]|nr:hypothetical protein [Verrucomicrobiota bacterium]